MEVPKIFRSVDEKVPICDVLCDVLKYWVS